MTSLKKPFLKRFLTIGVPLLLGIGYLAIWVGGDLSTALLQQIWYFPIIGIGGAIIANSTGVGGGVVFIPAFNILSVDGVIALNMTKIVAISMAIQCFGMSVGSMRWLKRIDAGIGNMPSGVSAETFYRICILVLVGCLPALWATQLLVEVSSRQLLVWFKYFSLALGLVLLITTWTVNRGREEQTDLLAFDEKILIGIGLLGGVATALFSVGVGELVALYLFIRHFPLRVCVAPAVIISALTVLAGMPFHLLNTTIPWEVVALAAPGAMIGGYIARPIAEALGARWLKTFAAIWISGSSLYLILLYT